MSATPAGQAGAILCVNAGSSSLKITLRDGSGETRLAAGAVEEVGTPRARIWLHDRGGQPVHDAPMAVLDHPGAFARLLDAIVALRAEPVVAVAHRIVHGGRNLVAPRLVDDALLGEITEQARLAPLHMPAQIATVIAARTSLATVPHVACFDTAFHRAMPELAQRFALPEWAWEDGICRYGFHGLSYENVVERLGVGSGRVVIAHLGNGASMAAVRNGQPVSTTMAFTPSAGLVMGTRPGDLDPGLLVALMRDRGMPVAEVDELVNRQSGLIGISGSTSDMRELLERRAADPRAALAVAMFCRSARMHIGALAADLGGIDLLVFTGGIGERAAAVRAEICEGLDHLGIRIDPARNDAGLGVVSPDGAACPVQIVPADEDRVLARHAARLITGLR